MLRLTALARCVVFALSGVWYLAAQTVLTVSSSSVTLTNDQAQSITVTAGGSSVAYSATGAPAWLNLYSSNNYTTPDTLAFQLASSLCGSCSATVTLTPTGGGTPVAVTVTYSTNGGGGGGAIIPSQSSLALSAPTGQPTSQMITLSTTATSPIQITSLTTTQPWLTASLSAFVVSVNNPAVLTVTANGAGYSNTVLNGQVLITPSSATQITIAVQFTVSGTSGGNTTIAAPPTLTFAYQVNQAVPPYQLVSVAPSGSFTATATVGTAQQWLNVSPANGTGPGYVLASVSPQGLSPANYPGTITIATPSGSQNITVNLLVSASTVLNANPASVNITTVGGAGPSNYSLQLSASDGSNQPVSLSTPTNWISIVSSPSLITPATVTIQVNPAGLCTGLSSGSLIATAGTANSPLVIPVVVLVTSGASATCGTAPSPQGVNPGAGNGAGQTFFFTFTDTRGFQDLSVVDILINNFLNGQGACYLAYSQTSGVLYLVNDAGTALLPGLVLNGSGSVSNSQCTVNGAGSFASGSGNTLILALNLTFNSNFAGNKVIYMAARDVALDNSGWQPLGTWGVPGGATGVGPAVARIVPASGAGSSVSFTITFTDTNGVQDLGILNVLVNNSLDGRQACYLAYSVPLNVLYLVNDTGTGLLPGIVPGGSGTANNSQCGVNAAASSVSASGNTVVLTLALSFAPGFDGNKVIYLAARSVGDVATSGWQALGSWTVQ